MNAAKAIARHTIILISKRGFSLALLVGAFLLVQHYGPVEATMVPPEQGKAHVTQAQKDARAEAAKCKTIKVEGDYPGGALVEYKDAEYPVYVEKVSEIDRALNWALGYIETSDIVGASFCR